MIIVISSPPPIDTTELAEKLASQNDLKIIEDSAPLICREYGFQTIYDMPFELQTEIREKLIKDHAEFVKSNDNILLNYSVFGYLADWMRWAWATTPTEKWEEILSVASETVNHYDRIYHVEEGKSLEYDGYVWFDQRNSKQINNLIKHLYTEMSVSEKLQ